jgi:hypothetical protein
MTMMLANAAASLQQVGAGPVGDRVVVGDGGVIGPSHAVWIAILLLALMLGLLALLASLRVGHWPTDSRRG